ncbi:Outer membrane protein assembly factor BamB, contains PQQ-like beta-propeller repeat [Halobiforma haloterrestris]|uniref:Outer membrane protein assembly factor BamB, contains PQQ-like beta-propeller repeat n=1 Tax=Natronobacterium haloterrestre TaxID=148448 RepID=A0A1I1DI96_NATHA|nr:PQQ-binding-like beta-propeller repeat protein [Halobiforma haloterrestris]SFB74554.1 Outer membrane protein assembly factor BamB, contains PQQ-like beta-propeller repeat [Halobiforma haloterrestris]
MNLVPEPAPSRRALLAGFGSLLGTGCLGADRSRSPERPAADRDEWRMYGRDPGRTRYVPDVAVSGDEPEVVWDRQVGASGWRPPVVADGTVFCQYANGLFVLDLETGAGQLANTYGGFGRETGPMALPRTEIYRDGSLVVPYGEAIAGYAADPDRFPQEISGFGDGLLRWWSDGETVGTDAAGIGSRSLGPGFTSVSFAPVAVAGDLVTVHAISDTVSAVRADDGNPRWRYDLEDAAPDDWDHGVGPLGHVVDETTDTVVVAGRLFTAPYLFGLDRATGSLEWTVDGRTTDARARSSDEPNGLLARDGRVYVVSMSEDRDLRLLAVDAASGERGWERTLSRSSHVGLAAGDDRLYSVATVSREGTDPLAITALDLEDGQVRWGRVLEDPTRGPPLGGGQPPTVAGNAVLVPGERGLHALERTTGDHLWTFTETVGTSGGGETERAAVTPAVVADDRLVVGTTLALYGLEVA